MCAQRILRVCLSNKHDTSPPSLSFIVLMCSMNQSAVLYCIYSVHILDFACVHISVWSSCHHLHIAPNYIVLAALAVVCCPERRIKHAATPSVPPTKPSSCRKSNHPSCLCVRVFEHHSFDPGCRQATMTHAHKALLCVLRMRAKMQCNARRHICSYLLAFQIVSTQFGAHTRVYSKQINNSHWWARLADLSVSAGLGTGMCCAVHWRKICNKPSYTFKFPTKSLLDALIPPDPHVDRSEQNHADPSYANGLCSATRARAKASGAKLHSSNALNRAGAAGQSAHDGGDERRKSSTAHGM